MTLNAGVTPVTNLTTIRARRLVTVAGDAVCYVVVCESRRVGSSGTRVLRLQLVLRSAAIGMLLLLAHELFAAQKRCDVRLAVLSGPNLTNVSSLAAPSHRGSCSWAHRSSPSAGRSVGYADRPAADWSANRVRREASGAMSTTGVGATAATAVASWAAPAAANRYEGWRGGFRRRFTLCLGLG